MKKYSFIITAVLILSLISVAGVDAQDKSKDEKLKEQQMKEAIDAEKKAIIEQKKAQEEAMKNLEVAKKEAEKAMQEFHIQRADPAMRDQLFNIYEGTGRGRTGDSHFFVPGVEWYGHTGSDSESTTWEFSKYVKQATFSRSYTFDVEPTVNTVVMAVNGDSKEGEIRIKIVMPNGKTYSDIIIDEFGNLNWRKSFTISDTENKDKAGDWKFEISATKASGYFRISLQTY